MQENRDNYSGDIYKLTKEASLIFLKVLAFSPEPAYFDINAFQIVAKSEKEDSDCVDSFLKDIFVSVEKSDTRDQGAYERFTKQRDFEETYRRSIEANKSILDELIACGMIKVLPNGHYCIPKNIYKYYEKTACRILGRKLGVNEVDAVRLRRYAQRNHAIHFTRSTVGFLLSLSCSGEEEPAIDKRFYSDCLQRTAALTWIFDHVDQSDYALYYCAVYTMYVFKSEKLPTYLKERDYRKRLAASYYAARSLSADELMVASLVNEARMASIKNSFELAQSLYQDAFHSLGKLKDEMSSNGIRHVYSRKYFGVNHREEASSITSRRLYDDIYSLVCLRYAEHCMANEGCKDDFNLYINKAYDGLWFHMRYHILSRLYQYLGIFSEDRKRKNMFLSLHRMCKIRLVGREDDAVDSWVRLLQYCHGQLKDVEDRHLQVRILYFIIVQAWDLLFKFRVNLVVSNGNRSDSLWLEMLIDNFLDRTGLWNVKLPIEVKDSISHIKKHIKN